MTLPDKYTKWALAKAALWPVFVLVLFWFWFYFPFLSMRFRIDWDAYTLSYPSLLFLSDSFHSGVFPFWNPLTMSGDAFLGQCATFAYHPILVATALLPQSWNLYYAMEVFILAAAFLGGLGTYYYLETLLKERVSALFGGVVFMFAAFIPLLGQPAVACSIASLPWFLFCLERMFSSPQGSVSGKVQALSFTLAISFLASYFGGFLYNICFMLLYALFRLVELKNIDRRDNVWKLGFWILLAGVVAILLVSPYLLPAIENRHFLYKGLAGDFVSPDPRLRGMAFRLDDVANILKGWEDVFHVLFSTARFSEKINKWVFGVGYLPLALCVGSFFLKQKPRIFRFFVFAALLSSLYVIGKHGFVFRFIYHYIPLLGNIRYPSFAFYTLQFSVIVCAAISLSRVLSVFNAQKRYMRLILPVILVAVAADLYFCSWRSGIFASHVYFKSDRAQMRALAMQDRVKDVSLENPARTLSKSKEFDFQNLDWIEKKVLFNQGYSTYDSPYYWYVKNLPVLAKLFFVPRKLILQPALARSEYVSDNAYMEALAGVIAAAGEKGEVLVDRLPAEFSRNGDDCSILSSRVTPNLFRAEVQSARPCFIALTDKNYPGWRVYVNGKRQDVVKTDYLFKGVYLGSGANSVEFRFFPASFYAGLGLCGAGFLCLMAPFILNFRKRPGVA